MVRGSGLTGVRRVMFGSSAGTRLVVSGGAVTVTVPAHPAGLVDVRVVTTHGTSAVVAADQFRFVPPPVVSSLGVTDGPVGGGTRVTVRGVNFVNVRRVLFGGTSGTSLVVASGGRQLTVTAPRHTAGAVDVVVVCAYGTSRSSASDRFTYYLAPLAVATTTLPQATVGLPVLDRLTASGGLPPYNWAAPGAPQGLTVTADGLLQGDPTATGSVAVPVQVTDAKGTVASATLTLNVPAALPLDCREGTCAHLTPDGQTVTVPATRVGAVYRDSNQTAVKLLLTGDAPTVGQVLVVQPGGQAPSGLIVAVTAVTPQNDGTTLLDVQPANPADAYAEGTVNAIGPATGAGPPLAAQHRSTTGKPGQLQATHARGSAQTSHASAPAALSCDSGATAQLHGLTVTPQLRPQVAMLWKHPLFGGGGIYPGTGGLTLFQFDLDGSITADLGISISGAATCTLTLPEVRSVVPAGALGAVILAVEPSLTFTTSGKLDIRTTAKLTCGAEYRWNSGKASRVSYCHPSSTPLQLSTDSGLDASLTGVLDASVTLDDIAGITGTLSATLHAGFHPSAHPIAALDATVDYDLGACLACFWKGSPARVSLVSGVLLDKTIATYDSAPQAVPNAGPPTITTSALPDAVVGSPYQQRLLTQDNRSGTWSFGGAGLPDGLYLDGDTIVGKATTPGSTDVEIDFTDPDGHAATRTLLLRVTTTAPRTSGAVANLDYCHQNVIPANDDNSTDAATLPFPITIGGTTYTSTYISNNGYLLFDGPSSSFTPDTLHPGSGPVIAPFYADVDTRDPGSQLVTYGSSPDGTTFCVNWVGVGYYNSHTDKVNSFQLLLTARPDAGTGDADITFNYDSIQWETGDASNGTGGIGGTAARAGNSDGTDPGTIELPGSGTTGALLDGARNSLTAGSHESNIPGRYIYTVRN